MRVCVLGLWHLGCVTSACLARIGHRVTGWDPDPAVTARLLEAKAPVFEPGLEELIRRGLDAGRLRFTSDPRDAVRGCRVFWVAMDTPVDVRDEADAEAVFRAVTGFFPLFPDRALILVSSQLPLGTVRRLEARAAERVPGRRLRFACLPENLRLGGAIERFLRPDRIVAGCRARTDRAAIARLLAPLKAPVEWMSVESAEMTKHAINSFLAASVAFINEIAALCETRGADAAEVARGLKTDSRIGPRAYLSPGGAFAGGTLARDVNYLSRLAKTAGTPLRLIPAIRSSNREHRTWAFRRLRACWGGSVRGRRVAVWGLTYKPGTDTLRRSGSLEICLRLHRAGAVIQAFDPAIPALPRKVAGAIRLAESATAALRGAEALIVATPWPVFRRVPGAAIARRLRGGPVLDEGRFLEESLANRSGVRYIRVGGS